MVVRQNVGPSGGVPAVVRQNSGGGRGGARGQERLIRYSLRVDFGPELAQAVFNSPLTHSVPNPPHIALSFSFDVFSIVISSDADQNRAASFMLTTSSDGEASLQSTKRSGRSGERKCRVSSHLLSSDKIKITEAISRKPGVDAGGDVDDTSFDPCSRRRLRHFLYQELREQEVS
ncbi:hypothetical protein M5K25_017644 [Dendrobium thyrsiflorum]|uniref:Uncharacterized protein n=1 Tax=Dendrobium thyrsiflorum TaxID=117978 RepID=A0ABD0UUN3_DENTH